MLLWSLPCTALYRERRPLLAAAWTRRKFDTFRAMLVRGNFPQRERWRLTAAALIHDRDALRSHYWPQPPQRSPSAPAEVRHWAGVISNIARIATRSDGQGGREVSLSDGNRVTLLHSGSVFLTRLLADLENAEQRIWLESYIVDDSPVTDEVFAALIRAKERGVRDVVLSLDWIGGLRCSRQKLRRLQAAGVDVVVFNPPTLRPMAPFAFLYLLAFYSRPLAYRNHRKIFIVDSVGYCGSANLMKEISAEHQGWFFDSTVKIEGPAVAHLSRVFCHSLEQARSSLAVRREPIRPAPAAVPRDEGGGMLVAVLESDRRRGVAEIQRAYQWLLRCANREISAITSYFAPPKELRDCLVAALKRGIPVDLFFSGCSDILGDRIATLYQAGRMMRNYRLNVLQSLDKHLHSKTLSVDGLAAIVGSLNWDRTSYARNLECAVLVLDGRFAFQLDALHGALKSRHSLESGGGGNLPRAYGHTAQVVEAILEDESLPRVEDITEELRADQGVHSWAKRAVTAVVRWAGGVSLDQSRAYGAMTLSMYVREALAFWKDNE